MRTLCTLMTLSLVMVLSPSPAQAWDGFDYDTGSVVETERGNLVRPGETIEIYDYGDGSYHDSDVDSIVRHGGAVEIDGYDDNTGDDRTLDMDK